MRLDMVADVDGVTDKGASSDIGHFLGDAVLDGEPGVLAGQYCLLVLISVGSEGE